jgi:2'-5' RNA ligase
MRGQPLATERFHITLDHLGDFAGVPQGIVDKALEAAARLEAPAFDLAFDRAASFAGRARSRPFVLQGAEGLQPLMSFRAALVAGMARRGLRAKTGFTPHVTLLYDDSLVPVQAIEPIGWTARQLVLVHSRLGKSQHIHLGRWPLREGA